MLLIVLTRIPFLPFPRSFVFVPRSCMVQSQKLKVLLYASLYSIDAVMTQLKWDFLMVRF